MQIQADQQEMQAKMQAEIHKYQADSQKEQAKLAYEAQEAERDRVLELEKARMDNATKLAIAQLNAENQKETLEKSQMFDAQKTVATFAREDMAKQKPIDEANERDSEMAELLGNLQQALMMLNNSISRPRVAVRDPKTNKPLYGRPMTDEEMMKMNGGLQ